MDNPYEYDDVENEYDEEDLDGFQEVDPSEERKPASTRDLDDMDAQEMEDLGVERSPSSDLSEVLDDPGTEDEYQEADEEEIEAAEVADLSQFGGRGRGFNADAFEEWVSISKRHPPLSYEETDRLVDLVQSDDPELREMAIDRLIRHNIKWIISVLRRMRGVGARVMDYPSDLRDDVLGYARLGFFYGVLRYDAEKASSRGTKGYKKTLLKYTEPWIAKYVREYLKKHRYRLNEDAALGLARLTRVERELKKTKGRRPTDEEIGEEIERQTREKLEREGEKDPDISRLRRRGAMTLDQIRVLRKHRTKGVSIDTPVGEGEDGGRTLADYISSSDPDAEAVLHEDELRRGLADRVEGVATEKDRWLLRRGNALLNRRQEDRHELANPEEGAILTGKSRDTVNTYLGRAMDMLRGEAEVDIDLLATPDAPDLTPTAAAAAAEQLDRLESRARKAGDDVPDTLQARLDEQRAVVGLARGIVRELVALRDVAAEDGVRSDPRNPDARLECPLDEQGGRTLRIQQQEFDCSACGVEHGDVVDWLQRSRQLSFSEALRIGMRRALRISPAFIDDEAGRTTFVRDPGRKERLQKLR